MSNNSDVRLIQLNNYIKPKLEENKSKNWVLNGRNNSFYQYIIDRNNGSVTNATINRSYTNLTYGRGLGNRNGQGGLSSDWIKFKSVLKDKELKKIIADFQLFGEASMQVIKKKNGDLDAIYHIPKDKIAPSLDNEDGEIEGYWYCKDWGKTTQNAPEFFPAFGTSKEAIEIYVIKPYSAGCNYFSNPDYFAGLSYAEMEEEIANYYINHIKNGLSFGYIINIPNGENLTPEEKDLLERKIKQNLTGSSNAGKFILSFNVGDKQIDVTLLQVNDAHKQWEYLTAECRQQIMTAHGVVSPMLFGIKDSTGLGNNADELDTAEAQLLKRVIAPKQQFILDALEDICVAYGINVDLYFKPLTEPVQNVQMSSHVCCSDEKKNTDLDEFIALGEEEDLENYDLIECKPVNYEEEALNLSSTGEANPYQKSRFDLFDTITRYRYAGRDNGQRDFCNKMVRAKKIYRIEDIEAMKDKPVNAGFGPEGASTYDIFKYKGGVNCYHYWEKLTYKRKNDKVKVDVKSPIAIDESKQQPAKGLAGVEPINMPNGGRLNK